MPLDILGRTRVTLVISTCITLPDRAGKSLKGHRVWDSLLKFLDLNEESLVIPRHQRGMNASLPFVHTARRSY